MKGLGAVLTLVAVAVCTGAATADPVTMQPTVLQRRPGVVLVNTGDATARIQMCEPVRSVAYKAAWLHATIATDKRAVYLTADPPGGTANIWVSVGDDPTPLQFLVRATPQQLGTSLYEVGCPSTAQGAPPAKPASPTSSSSAPAPTSTGASASAVPHSAPTSVPVPAAPATPRATAAAWDAFVQGLTPHQWDLLTALITSPSASAAAAFDATLTADQRTQWEPLAASMSLPGAATAPAHAAAAPGPGPLPAWLPWQATATTVGSGMLITYSLQNTGTSPVVLDQARLRVLAPDGTPIPSVTVSRQDTSGYDGRVPGGGAESGVIRVPVVPQGGVRIVWPVVVVDGAGGTTYQISQSLP